MLEVGKTDGSFGQNGPRKAGSRKRKQGLQHVFTGENVASLTLPASANPPSKRKPTRASSHQTTPPAMQPPSLPYRRNSAQVADPTNQNMPSYQNQPQQHTVQQDTSRTDLTHLTASPYQGGLVTLIPEQLYYQEQQSSQSKSNIVFVNIVETHDCNRFRLKARRRALTVTTTRARAWGATAGATIDD